MYDQCCCSVVRQKDKKLNLQKLKSSVSTSGEVHLDPLNFAELLPRRSGISLSA